MSTLMVITDQMYVPSIDLSQDTMFRWSITFTELDRTLKPKKNFIKI